MRKFLMLLLSAGLVCGGCFAECSPSPISYEDWYWPYDPDPRGNRHGTVEVINNTPHDMFLFKGSDLIRANIVGGVRAWTSANVNFSNEIDFAIGGFTLLRAVRQTEFVANGSNSAVDYTALVTYGAGRRFTTEIRSTREGDFSYRVQNRSRDFAMELRKDSPAGERVAFLSRGENRIIQTPDSSQITLFPVWVAFNTQTKSIVSFSPDWLLNARNIQPALPGHASPYFFPDGGTGTIAFSEIVLPFATIIVSNSTGILAGFREGTTIRTAESGHVHVPSGIRDMYEIAAESSGLDLNFIVGPPVFPNIVVPVRFEADPDALPVIENGYVYTVALNHITGYPTDQASSYTAWLVKRDAINVSDLMISF
jgi:hypothetical protein